MGQKITTIEAIAADDKVGKAVHAAWVKHDVAQCGYCQSGQIMSATALLKGKKKPTDADIDAAMAGNVCRCGTYVRIRAAIHDAAEVVGFFFHPPKNTEQENTMHFDAQTARAHMPKGLVALMDQAQGAINTEANAAATEGVARRTFLKAAAASGFALGAYPLVASAQGARRRCARRAQAFRAALGLCAH